MKSILGLLLWILSSGAYPAMPQMAGNFTPTGSMTTPRAGHSATLLNNGKVLMAGGTSIGFPPGYLASAELYDPSTGAFSAVGNMNTARSLHSATLLPDGRVLIAGGLTAPANSITGSAELYDPSTGTFTQAREVSSGPRQARHAATLLGNGKVLLAGIGAGAALYDPATGAFDPAGPYAVPETELVANGTVLPDGKVLLTGCTGFCTGGFAQVYDPATNTFSNTGPMRFWFNVNTTTLLMNGKVLIAGSTENDGHPSDAELYDFAAGTFSTLGQTIGPHQFSAATLLPDGTVLITGGQLPGGMGDAGAELYTAGPNGTFHRTASMGARRHSHTATLLGDGTVLIAGGSSDWPTLASTAEIYHPAELVTTPLLLSLPGNRQGQGAILHAGTSRVVSSDFPATAGQPLEIYLTGLANGSAIPPHVIIGGRMAEVLYFGNTPGFAGLNQVNVRVPNGVAPGPAVRVRLNYLTRSSNEVTIGVR